MGEPGASTVLRHATLADGSTADVRLSGATITGVGADVGEDGEDVVDLSGHVLLASAIEPHAHLDKAFLSERLENPAGDLRGAIEAMVAARPDLSVADTV
jgi:cytosine deaminase